MAKNLSTDKIKGYYDGPISELLREQFELRKAKNSKYSIRSFANFLDIDQSLLTKVMNGQRSLSFEKTERCLEVLGITDTQKYLNKKFRKINFKTLEEATFEMISEWYYFAVLELFNLENFKVNPESVSKKMGFPLEQSFEILNRLEEYKFIDKDGDNYAILSHNTSWASFDTTSEARRTHQKNLLQKSIETIDEVPVDLRDHSSITLAINKSEMPAFKETIKEVRRQLMETFQKKEGYDEVYQIQISFFPLSKV